MHRLPSVLKGVILVLFVLIVSSTIASALGVRTGEWGEGVAAERRWNPYAGMIALEIGYRVLMVVGAIILYRLLGNDGVESLIEGQRAPRGVEGRRGEDCEGGADWVRVAFRSSLLLTIICAIGYRMTIWVCGWTGAADSDILNSILRSATRGCRWLAYGWQIARCMCLLLFLIILHANGKRELHSHTLNTHCVGD